MSGKKMANLDIIKAKLSQRSFLIRVIYYFVSVCIPFVIFGTTLWMILSGRWLEDAMGYCINTIMIVSSWMIVAFETSSKLSVSNHKDGNDSNFKIVDCMTIIFTVITICYSFLQICNPPIVFSQIMKLILWFSAIITYTIWAKPTRLKVLCMCLVATLISTLFIMPATYREYYEKVIEECKWESYPVGNEEVYDLQSGKYALSERSKSTDLLASFENLMQDDFFAKNYHETLYPLAKRYMEDRENVNTAEPFDVSFTYDLSNLKTPNVYIWQKRPFSYNIKVLSAQAPVALYKTERVTEVGFEAERIIGAEQDTVWIQYKNIKGLSGYKKVTLLSGFVQSADGRDSAEMPTVSFKFWGYDILIWAAVMLVMILLAVGFVMDERKVCSKTKTVYTAISSVLSAAFVIYVVSIIVK